MIKTARESEKALGLSKKVKIVYSSRFEDKSEEIDFLNNENKFLYKNLKTAQKFSDEFTNLNAQNFASFYTDLFSHQGKPNNLEQEKVKQKVNDYFESFKNSKMEFIITNEDLEKVITISYGYLPNDFNRSLVTPIPKKGPLNGPSDFRPISVSSAFSIIFESFLLSKMDCFNDLNPNQFGYKKNSSCKQAHFIVNETINYYRHGGSKFHLVSLDATKAFDRLWRDGLFFKLIVKIPKDLWRILFLYCKNSKIKIKFIGKISESASTYEGVKQGGVLSPYLFNFFIDNLITNCFEKNIGAKIDKTLVSIIAYCDDIILMAPSFNHCQCLLSECAEFGKTWKLEFNAAKSVAISFYKTRVAFDSRFILNGNIIPNVSGLIYLGLPVGSYEFINEFLEKKWKSVEKSLYCLYDLGCKPKMMSPNLVSFLYKTYCQSIFQYVLDNIYMSETKLKEFDTRQNLLIKQVICLNKYSKMKELRNTCQINGPVFDDKIIEEKIREILSKETKKDINDLKSRIEKVETSQSSLESTVKDQIDKLVKVASEVAIVKEEIKYPIKLKWAI
ncbi:unnamed protein product [Brachionus calyciflorus]|uniref:Reverse transcriptase domain-containing protein n=1 Tax=Brachionus calyciflorus TaxID=104777 RepID=A0A814NLU6_9BILA|nr:unnamed protein product [Brachionus calyciflorus]